MKNKIFYFAAIVVVVVLVMLCNNKTSNFMTAGGGGISLKELNDTTKTNVAVFGEANVSDENIFHVNGIVNWEHQYNNFYVGSDFIGTVSSKFGIMCPTLDARCGYDFNKYRLEAKIGNFNRNGVTTVGFDPQFSTFCILAGEGASVSNAVQLSLSSKNTKVLVGHQGGSSFYTFDGNYYAGIEQKIGNFAFSGGVNLAEQTTGYAAAKWANKNNVCTLTCNKLGSKDHNFILSYFYNNISLGKGFVMNVGTALFGNSEQQGGRLVAAVSKDKMKLFAEVGGCLLQDVFKPMAGMGVSYKL